MQALINSVAAQLLAVSDADALSRVEHGHANGEAVGQPSDVSKHARIAIEAVVPTVDDGRFAAKVIVGQCVDVYADIFSDGHEKLSAVVRWRCVRDGAGVGDSLWHESTMTLLANDRWHAAIKLDRIGKYEFAIYAWLDKFKTYADELEKKAAVGLNVSLELREGHALVKHALANPYPDASIHVILQDLEQALTAFCEPTAIPTNNDDSAYHNAIALLLSPVTAQCMAHAGPRAFLISSPCYPLRCERTAAAFASWYELFPRSQSGDVHRHGTFDDVITRLPAIAAMGFDTLYFPPIHPIGHRHRKGRDNTLTPAPDDPGSPYAIGAAEGGHTAIHPELGSFEDFRRLRAAAEAHGLELALDFAIQCAPDHPWLTEHPDWFEWRPDGSIRYAENPPKKYQDIVNVDFYAAGAVPELWHELRDVLLFWVAQGIKIFRVDNPHTKPFPFWEWVIGDVQDAHPDVIFLSESFTQPKRMYRLAKLGFTQSYTYFTWRNNKYELSEYLKELATAPLRDYFRPHFFVNTPDINPLFLQQSGRNGFLIRAALATTLSGLWGMYSGFELCEAQAVPGKEEYLHSEKYEIRAWDWNKEGNIIAEITQLNRIRHAHPALHTHANVDFLAANNEQILYYVKATAPNSATSHPHISDEQSYPAPFGDDVLLIAVNLDQHHEQGAQIELPLWRFGLPDDGSVDVIDLMTQRYFVWRGKYQSIHLPTQALPFSIWQLRSTRQRYAALGDPRKNPHATII
jgi:starch synthase (maltosyl-transferring)